MGIANLLLKFPAGYRLSARLLGGSVRETYVREYVRPGPGARVLDLGCGPGDVLAYLPPCDYVGVDLDPGYIAAARERFGDRGTFRCGPAEDVVEPDPGSFDVVTATGLLHHLTDDQAEGVFRVARAALRPGGRLVTFDGCFVPGQSRFARWMLRRDRGKFVRTEPEYVRLARRVFADVAPAVRHDLLRLPYTHLILTCTSPAGG